jgi:hypothetical protein
MNSDDIETSIVKKQTEWQAYVEKLVTLKDAAIALGLPGFKITRAARAGIFPTYSLFNKRKLVRLSEVVAAIEASKKGGSNG